MPEARTPGLLGRLPGRVPAGLGTLNYYAAGPLPAPPASVAVPAVADWGMLGNDRYGDCGVAGLEHGFMADAADTSVTETQASGQQAVTYYLKYTGGQDDGVVLADYLAYVRRTGYYGRKVTAYAPVAVHDVPTLQTAITLYDFAYTGITVTGAMEGAFAAGKPWTTATLRGEELGGHCVPVVGYDDEHLLAVTWGQVQAITYPAWHRMSGEAWAVITGELSRGDGHGVSLAALTADLNRLNA